MNDRPKREPMKIIPAGGITYLAPLTGSQVWYWGTDYTSGDLYEAEELYRDGHRISRNRLIFVHAPDGRASISVSPPGTAKLP